jgi:hypothetical protein
MDRADIGLILVGPDPEGILSDIDRQNIYKIGPLYGKEKFDLLSAADVYCLPGAVCRRVPLRASVCYGGG